MCLLLKNGFNLASLICGNAAEMPIFPSLTQNLNDGLPTFRITLPGRENLKVCLCPTPRDVMAENPLDLEES